MSFLRAIRAAVTDRQDNAERCAPCAHFLGDALSLEAALPGLTALSSADAAVRAQDGLCIRHDRMTNGLQRCAAFTAPDR